MARILVIEDDPIYRELLEKGLSRAGHRVVTADDGKEGLEKCRAESWDLVITDILMPEMDGLETIQAIRRLGGEGKIIAISGGGRFFDSNYNVRLAKLMGADLTLIKPFSFRALFDAMKSLSVGEALGEVLLHQG